MSVGYYRRQPPATPEQIEELQRRIGEPLPASYRAYLAEQDGGRLDNNNQAVNTIFGLGDLPDDDSLWEQLDEPARCAALEILARLIVRMLVAAANEASHE